MLRHQALLLQIHVRILGPGVVEPRVPKDQISSLVSDLSESLGLERGAGVTLDELMPPTLDTASAPTASSSSEPSRPQAPPPRSAFGLSFGFFGSRASQATSQTAAAQPGTRLSLPGRFGSFVAGAVKTKVQVAAPAANNKRKVGGGSPADKGGPAAADSDKGQGGPGRPKQEMESRYEDSSSSNNCQLSTRSAMI